VPAGPPLLGQIEQVALTVTGPSAFSPASAQHRNGTNVPSLPL